MGTINLQTIGGINRLRQKGGVSREVLYELLNGYVTTDNSVVSRQGTVTEYDLPPGTKGMMAHNGGLVVFSHEAQTVPEGVTCEILAHPTSPGFALHEIHFAAPFLGAPYVVAEFVDGQVFHYWLQRRDEWEAETAYQLGDVVEPTTPNGFAYRATRLNPPEVVWTPNAPREVGDRVEPTVTNGFVYEVTDVTGDAPKSGATEPDWIAEDGAEVIEDTDLTPIAPAGTATSDVDLTLPPDVEERYSGTIAGGFAKWGKNQ